MALFYEATTLITFDSLIIDLGQHTGFHERIEIANNSHTGVSVCKLAELSPWYCKLRAAAILNCLIIKSTPVSNAFGLT